MNPSAIGPTNRRQLMRYRFPSTMALAVVMLAGAGGRARAQSTDGLAMPRPDQPARGAEVEAKKLTKLPKQTKFVEAEYPKAAVEKNIETDVVLMLDINAEGKVDQVSIVTPAPAEGYGFDEAALIAAHEFEFEPAEMDGKKIPVQITYKYKFRLGAKKSAAPDGGVPAPPGDAGSRPAPAEAATPAAAPVANFGGVLRERGTRLPLAGALVTVFRDDGEKALGFEATADEKGAFTFFDLAAGDWKVLIEPAGYYPYRTTETIKAGERVDVVYYVERGIYNPYDVTVTATRPRKEVSRTVITAQELDKVPGTFGDPLAVVQNFAGVARPPPLSGLLIIRGSSPQDSKIFADGAEIPLIYHFGGLRTVLPVGVIDALDFYPGNFSTMYGRAIGGVVDVRIKKLQPKKVGGYADVNVFDTGVYLEVPLGDKGGIAVAGRRSYIDALLKATVPSDAPVNLITAPRYYDYQLLANYRPTPAHDFRALLIGSDDRLELLFRNPGALTAQLSNNQLSFSTTFYRSLLTYNFIPNDTFENSFKVAQGRNAVDAKFGQLQFNLHTYVSQIRDTIRVKPGERLTLVGGVDALFSKTDVFVRAPLPPREGDPPGMPNLNNLLTTNRAGILDFWPAFFAEAEVKPIPSLLLVPGVRLDRLAFAKEWVTQPRLTARWSVVDRVTLKAGAGLFSQDPTPDAVDPNFGNPNLKSEKAWHYSAGVEYKPRPYITIDATGFYKDITNLVSATDAMVTGADGTVRPLRYDNAGKGRAVGLELMVRHDFTNNFSGWLAYTLSRSTRLDSGETKWRLFDYDQTHILTMIGSYQLPRNWLVGGRFRLVSGNPITPVSGAVYNAANDRYYPSYGETNSGRLPLFHELDLRVDKRWIYNGWILNVYLDVQNIYNRSNTEDYDYNFNYRKSNPQQGLPILPILGIKGEY
jgi:TonB family protein